MPVYDYECSCGLRVTAIRTIELRTIGPKCELCGGDTHKIVSRSNVNPDIYEGYFDPNLAPMYATGERGQGTWVRGKAHRKQLMREFGLGECG